MPDHFYTKDNIAEEFRDVVGEYTYGMPEISGYGAENLKIGKFCSFAGDVKLLIGGGHNFHNFTQYPFDNIKNEDGRVWQFEKSATPAFEARGTKQGVFIGNDVWVGCRVTILPGTVIEDGAVIGACSVVSGRVPAYSVYAGNPAREINMRFPETVIRRMLEVKWWDWPEEKILEALPLLENVYTFLEKYHG